MSFLSSSSLHVSVHPLFCVHNGSRTIDLDVVSSLSDTDNVIVSLSDHNNAIVLKDEQSTLSLPWLIVNGYKICLRPCGLTQLYKPIQLTTDIQQTSQGNSDICARSDRSHSSHKVLHQRTDKAQHRQQAHPGTNNLDPRQANSLISVEKSCREISLKLSRHCNITTAKLFSSH